MILLDNIHTGYPDHNIISSSNANVFAKVELAFVVDEMGYKPMAVLRLVYYYIVFNELQLIDLVTLTKHFIGLCQRLQHWNNTGNYLAE